MKQSPVLSGEEALMTRTISEDRMPLTVQDLSRIDDTSTAQAAPDRVYTELRRRILNFDLPPGATLGRTEIAAHFSVSQTPVREALQRLELDGLVLIYPQSKTLVSRIDVRQLSETQFLRVAVETEIVRRLAENPNPDALARANALIQMQLALVESTDQMAMFSDLDRRFHRTLFEAMGVGSLHSMVTRRLGHMYRAQRLELPRKGKMQAIVDAHRAILDGIASGNAERAVASMRSHLSGTILRIASLRKEHPKFFTEDAFVLTGWSIGEDGWE